MRSTLKRLVVLAGVGAAAAVAPVASAGAATLPFASSWLPVTAPHFPVSGLPAFTPPAFTPGSLTFVGPSLGQVAAVIGPTVITTAPSTFINTNIQVAAGTNGSGGQAAP